MEKLHQLAFILILYVHFTLPASRSHSKHEWKQSERKSVFLFSPAFQPRSAFWGLAQLTGLSNVSSTISEWWVSGLLHSQWSCHSPSDSTPGVWSGQVSSPFCHHSLMGTMQESDGDPVLTGRLLLNASCTLLQDCKLLKDRLYFPCSWITLITLHMTNAPWIFDDAEWMHWSINWRQ